MAPARPTVPPSQSGAALYYGCLILVAVAGTLLRTQGIETRSIWFDESFSWRIASFPVREAVERIGQDNHPPLYFLLLKGWVAVFGTSEVALRSLSALLGGATILAAAALTLEVVRARGERDTVRAERAAALIAAVLVAVSVVHIRWAWEVRMYTLGTTFSALTSWAMLRALRSDAVGAWVGYGALALLFAYTHYYALFSLVAQAVFVAGSLVFEARGRPVRVVTAPRFWHALLALAVVAVGWLPWVPSFLAQRQQVEDQFWTNPVRTSDVTRAACRLFVAPENVRFESGEAAVVAALAALPVLALAACRPRRGEAYLVLAVLLPLAIPVALSRLGTDVFHPRYLLFAHLHLLVGVGVLLGRVPEAGVRFASTGLLAALGLAVYADFWEHMRVADRPGMKAAMTLVNAERRPGELLVVSQSLIHSPVLYYAADLRDLYLYDDGRPIPHYRGAPVVLPGELADDRKLASYPSGRVWAVNMRGGTWGSHAVPALPGWKPVAEYRFPEVYDIQGEIVVELYEVGSPKTAATW